jgi:GTP-binding protein EngB required for normal cell division
MNTNQNSEFTVNEISQRFQANLTQFEQFLSSQDNEQIKAIQQELRQNLDQYYQNGILTIAFIGQYSAGKSTIISALTGRRDIYIDADIATDTTTHYDWNGIKIIDTPGLYTDRTEHDKITYDAIEKADLLVFCLTSNLFDNITADNFKKLAYEQEYSGKMMLVINKMSQASGDEQELITNYKDSLAKGLAPYSLDAFPLLFIDAKDYCEGIDENEEFLIEISRFPEFIEQLNDFIKQRQIMARLDTPVRIALSSLNKTESAIQRDDDEDSAYLELVNRCVIKVEKERTRFRTEIEGIALDLYSEVQREANPLLDKLGNVESEQEWNDLGNKADQNIEKHCQSAQQKIEKIANQAQISLMESLEEVLQGNLAQTLIQRLENNEKVSAKQVNQNSSQWTSKLKNLLELGDFVSGTLSNAAKNATPLVGANGFLKAGNVAGSGLHQGVYQIGKFLGVNFKPWGAVNLAKGLGNVAKVAGPFLAIGALFIDINQSNEEEKQSEELSKARKEINSQFIELAQQLQTQLESIGREVEKQLYDETAEKIEQLREAYYKNINENKEQMQALKQLRQEFNAILSEINSSLG